jgi:hypothetical protein
MPPLLTIQLKALEVCEPTQPAPAGSSTIYELLFGQGEKLSCLNTMNCLNGRNRCESPTTSCKLTKEIVDTPHKFASSVLE